ncbi:MAG TPA: endonuclease [Burkholderiaceae bacterium]|jgi:excinuclease Cho
MQVRVTSVGLIMAPEPADQFVYPDHIDRANIDALPSKPGIYIFKDENGLPLYIGKSINIRTRVLSHLRTPTEARMLQQSRYVEFQRTAGEIGALLLESRLIKEMQPVHNKKLRRTREMCSLLLKKEIRFGAPQIVSARDFDFAKTDDLYGLFATRRAALETLTEIVNRECLCSAVTGLERVTPGRACFARQLKRCKGACTGEESLDDHFTRLEAALHDMRVVSWPFEGAIGIAEESDGWIQTHIVDHWFYLGYTDGISDVSSIIQPRKRSFDVDTYKILVKPLMLGELNIQSVTIAGVTTSSLARYVKQIPALFN